MDEGAGGSASRETMSMEDAAKVIGRSVDTVRRWIDENERAGRPVAERDRDREGRVVAGSWRRPYADEVERWRARRAGEGVEPGGQAAVYPVSPAAPAG